MKKFGFIMCLAACALMGCEAMHQHGKDQEDHEGKEVKVSIDQVPPAARATFVRESGGAAISSVDMEQDEGKTLYEADAILDGKNYEIKVDAAGQLISKKIDNEEGEHEDADKGGKSEDKD